jgi:hypothetical protein
MPDVEAVGEGEGKSPSVSSALPSRYRRQVGAAPIPFAQINAKDTFLCCGGCRCGGVSCCGCRFHRASPRKKKKKEKKKKKSRKISISSVC